MTDTPTLDFLKNGLSDRHDSSDEWAGFVALALNFIRAAFQDGGGQPICPWLSGNIARPERRKAVRYTIGVFLRHLDPATLYVGHWSAKGDFIPLEMAAITREAGLCRRRCERAVSFLKAIGFVQVFPPRHNCNPVPYAGLRVVRALTPSFFEWAGLSQLLEQVRSGYGRIEVEGGQP